MTRSALNGSPGFGHDRRRDRGIRETDGGRPERAEAYSGDAGLDAGHGVGHLRLVH